MAKLSAIFHLIFVEGKTCTIAWGPCQNDAICDAQCNNHYRGEGFCNFIIATRQRQCFCAYPC
ncbi:hypothetical protein MKX03_025530 [Papaver bracteatum]|nr:hypothetical protein MKX03_025530 [Papaver bracteatum]